MVIMEGSPPNSKSFVRKIPFEKSVGVMIVRLMIAILNTGGAGASVVVILERTAVCATITQETKQPGELGRVGRKN